VSAYPDRRDGDRIVGPVTEASIPTGMRRAGTGRAAGSVRRGGDRARTTGP
jgi:hypothetical protein